MTLGLMDTATRTRFDRLCRRVAVETDGPGITLAQIGLCGDLARELGKDAPDAERVAELRERLGLEEEVR